MHIMRRLDNNTITKAVDKTNSYSSGWGGVSDGEIIPKFQPYLSHSLNPK